MRGCLFVLALGALVALAGAWFGGPALAGAAIQVALAGAGIEGRPTHVRVVADPPLAILAGHADEVVITADRATFGEVDAARLELTLFDVDLVGRTFASVRGRLTGVTVRDDGGRIRLGEVRVAGPAGAAEAFVTIEGEEAARAATQALHDALGLPVGSGRLLEPDRLRFSLGGSSVDGILVVEGDGSLWLAADLPGRPRVPVMDAHPLEVRSAAVVDGRLVLVGTLDVAALLNP